MELESEDFQAFRVAGEENTNGLLKVFNEHDTVGSFLCDEDVHIPIFPSVLENAVEDVKYSFDFDGVVVMLNDPSCLQASVHYLACGKVDMSKVSNHWHLLKKHLDLRQYSSEGIKALHKSIGMVVGLVDGGFFLNVTCVPENPACAHPMFRLESTTKAYAQGMLKALFQDFSERLQLLPAEELKRPSLMKSSLGIVTKLNILSQDQRFILQVFNQCVMHANHDINMKILVSLSKFGQKDGREFNLASLVDPAGVRDVSYHAACNITATDPSTDLLWSRYGLQELVGRRGSLYSAYSFCEAANYQSSLCNKALEVDVQLLQVLNNRSAVINFLQLYSDTPHCHLLHDLPHPVSRVITLCGLHTGRHGNMLKSHAARYLMHHEDLAKKTACGVSLRLEAVFLVKPDFPVRLSPRYFFVRSCLDYLLERVPLVVPFKESGNGRGLRYVMHSVTSYLIGALGSLYMAKEGLGGYTSSWRSFELELALEMLFYGKVRGRYSVQYAAALGVCPTSPDSMTRMRGFLGLAPPGSASVGESPPPLDIWISDKAQQGRVERIFSLSDYTQAGTVVLGEQLLRILLFDLYRRNDRLPIDVLKGPDWPIGNLVGCRSLKEFCHELCSRKGFGYPHTFGRALEIVRLFSKDPEPCLLMAMSPLKFFPHIKYWDESRHLKASWNFKDFVELHKAFELPSAASRAATYLGEVCARLDQMELTFARNLKKYKAQGMPWLERCVACLPKGMPKEKMLTSLVFVSCVGLVMNGDFVHFERLKNLIGNMPVTQRHLQELGILSNLLLLHNPKVWRFHESVPYKVEVVVAGPTSREGQRRPRTESNAEEQEEQVEQDVEAEEELVTVLQTATVPANVFTRWSEQETSFVDLNDRVPHSQAYAIYKTRCRVSGIPVRTFESFRLKRRRLLVEVD